MNNSIFNKIDLDKATAIYLGRLPAEFAYTDSHFKDCWDLHPTAYHQIEFFGKTVDTPRWQQAYGVDYRYTGAKNNALPIHSLLQPYVDWTKEHIHQDLNGALLNWYDGMTGHYIGAHRDDTRDLVEGTPIITISLGQERVFRFRPWKQKGFKDLTVSHGDVLIIPWETNLKWTHEVPHFKKYMGKRISITLRVFDIEN